MKNKYYFCAVQITTMNNKKSAFQLRVNIAKECQSILREWQSKLFLKNKDFTQAETVEYIIKNFKDNK